MNEEKRKKAVALSYDAETDKAPVVKGKGQGLVAEKIIERAKASDVPVKEDAGLVELLDQVDVNETIPEELFHAVAEVFAFIYQMDENAKKQ